MEPRLISSKPPRPRAPTTSSSASAAAESRTARGAGRHLLEHADLGVLLRLYRHDLVESPSTWWLRRAARGVVSAHAVTSGTSRSAASSKAKVIAACPAESRPRPARPARGAGWRAATHRGRRPPGPKRARPLARRPTRAASRAAHHIRGCRPPPCRRPGCARTAPGPPTRRPGPRGPGRVRAPTRRTAARGSGSRGRAAWPGRTGPTRWAARCDPASRPGSPSASYRGPWLPWPPSAAPERRRATVVASHDSVCRPGHGDHLQSPSASLAPLSATTGKKSLRRIPDVGTLTAPCRVTYE